MKTLNREDILKLSRKISLVNIESLGNVYLKALPAGVVIELSKKLNDGQITQEEFTYQLIVTSVVDKDGNSILSVDDAKEISVDALKELTDKIAEFNKLDTTKAREELKKIQNGGSFIN